MIDKEDIIYKFKKSYDIAHCRDYFCCVGGSANIYDVKSGELKTSFTDIKQPNFSVFTSDNRLIVKTTRGYYFIYDLISQTLINKLRPPKGVLGSNTKFALTPDNKFIIDSANIFPVSQLMIMEIETGKYTLYDLNGVKTCNVLHNESKSIFYIVTSRNETVNDPATHYVDFYSFAYPYHEVDLQNMPVPKYKYISNIDYRFDKFALIGYKDVISIYDVKKKAEEQFNYKKDGVLYHLKWSKNGKYIVLAESRKIHVYNVETKTCIKTYDVNYGCFAEFYDNDTKLLIGTWEKGYCIDIKIRDG